MAMFENVTEQEMQAVVARHIATKDGVFDKAKIPEYITKYANMCPVATADENGFNELQKAYFVISKETAGGAPSAPVNPTVTNPVATQPTSTISAAQQANISRQLMAEKAIHDAVSANTGIDNYVLDKPAPKDIIPNGTKAVINQKSWENFMKKVNDGTYTVCADDGEDIAADKRIASTSNFNTLKAAAEAKTPVDVYIGNLVTKPIGYLVRKGTQNGTEATPVQMTREMLKDFVTLKGAGFVLASPGKPGVYLRYIKPQQDPDNPGKQKVGHTVLADKNKKDAMESGAYVISQEVTKETQTATVKAALPIRVTKKGKFRKDGVTPLTQTIRISCSAELPVLKRKAEFLEVFKDPAATNAELMEVPTGEQANKIFLAQREQISALMAKAANPDTMYQVAEIADDLKKFTAPAESAPAAAF